MGLRLPPSTHGRPLGFPRQRPLAARAPGMPAVDPLPLGAQHAPASALEVRPLVDAGEEGAADPRARDRDPDRGLSRFHLWAPRARAPPPTLGRRVRVHLAQMGPLPRRPFLG